MDPNKFTKKTQEAVSEAQNLAIRFGHQQIDAEHLLYALATQESGLVPQILSKLGVDAQAYTGAIEAEINKLPKVSGPGAPCCCALKSIRRLVIFMASSSISARAMRAA